MGWKKIIDLGKKAWKWFRLVAGTKTVKWAVSTLLVPWLMRTLARNGVTLPLDAVKELVSLITGQAASSLTATTALGGAVAVGGMALANDSWRDFKRNYYVARHGEEAGAKQFNKWIAENNLRREIKAQAKADRRKRAGGMA